MTHFKHAGAEANFDVIKHTTQYGKKSYLFGNYFYVPHLKKKYKIDKNGIRNNIINNYIKINFGSGNSFMSIAYSRQVKEILLRRKERIISKSLLYISLFGIQVYPFDDTNDS